MCCVQILSTIGKISLVTRVICNIAIKLNSVFCNFSILTILLDSNRRLKVRVTQIYYYQTTKQWLK